MGNWFGREDAEGQSTGPGSETGLLVLEVSLRWLSLPYTLCLKASPGPGGKKVWSLHHWL